MRWADNVVEESTTTTTLAYQLGGVPASGEAPGALTAGPLFTLGGVIVIPAVARRLAIPAVSEMIAIPAVSRRLYIPTSEFVILIAA